MDYTTITACTALSMLATMINLLHAGG